MPLQIVAELAVIVAIGKLITFTITSSVLVQPFDVPVTVYVVVTNGVAVTLTVFVALKPVDGLHTYVVAPLAVKVVVPPAQIVASTPAVTTGNGVTTTVVTELVAEQPLSVTVTL